MASENLTLNFEPGPINKKNMNASSAPGNAIDKKITKTMKPLSLRPNRSIKKTNSLKQAFNKAK